MVGIYMGYIWDIGLYNTAMVGRRVGEVEFFHL
jgi:hypothetical protein